MSGTKKLSRQKSVMSVESNPTLSGGDVSVASLKVESLTDAVPIGPDQLKALIRDLNAFEANEERLKLLDTAKLPYLFASDDLSKLLDITPSVKTRIAMIGMVGPRLTDPRSKMAYFTGLFRFNEEKETVEEILKARAQTMASAIFTKGDGLKALAGRGGRGPGSGGGPLLVGRGGRGRGGRGGSGASSTSAPSTSAPDPIPVPVEVQPEPARVSETGSSRPRANSDCDDLGEQPITNFDDILEHLDSITVSKKTPTRTMSAIIEVDCDDSRPGSFIIPSSQSEVFDDRPETVTPRTDAEAHSHASSINESTSKTDASSTISKLFPTCESPHPSGEPLSQVTTAESDKSHTELPADSREVQENLLPSLSERPTSNKFDSSIMTSPIPLSKQSSAKITPQSQSKRAATLDELEIVKKESARTAAPASASVDALVDPVRVEPYLSLASMETSGFRSMTGSEKSTYSTSATKAAPGSTSVRLATVVATPKMSLLGEAPPPTQSSLPHLAVPTGNDVRVANVHAHNGLQHASTDSRVIKQHVSDEASNSVSTSNSPIDTNLQGRPFTTRANTEPNRRNSDFFGLDAAVSSSSSPHTMPAGAGMPTKTVTAVGIRASAPAYSDLASKCAFLVHMSKDDFLTMAPEPRIERGDDQLYYSYRELMRKNFYKEYGDVQGHELERYLTDEEFLKVFQKSKTAFAEQVRWKQVEQKKKVLLF